MWIVISILLIGSLIAISEAPSLMRKKMFKELSFFAVILSIGVALNIMQALRIPLPNPLDLITAIHKPISDVIMKMLESR